MSPPASALGRSRARCKNVLISGAGLAGLTLAYWLSRHGFSPTVVERAPALRDEARRSTFAARRSGSRADRGSWALRQARTGTRGMTYASATGKHLASMSAAR